MDVRIENISKKFGDKNLFNDLSHEFISGSLTAITGPSGVGKTTLLNCIGMLVPIDNGKIFFDSNDVSKLSQNKKTELYKGSGMKKINTFLRERTKKVKKVRCVIQF
jgi:ABC-type sugar transport system ATPase subunit